MNIKLLLLIIVFGFNLIGHDFVSPPVFKPIEFESVRPTVLGIRKDTAVAIGIIGILAGLRMLILCESAKGDAISRAKRDNEYILKYKPNDKHLLKDEKKVFAEYTKARNIILCILTCALALTYQGLK